MLHRRTRRTNNHLVCGHLDGIGRKLLEFDPGMRNTYRAGNIDLLHGTCNLKIRLNLYNLVRQTDNGELFALQFNGERPVTRLVQRQRSIKANAAFARIRRATQHNIRAFPFSLKTDIFHLNAQRRNNHPAFVE